MLRNKSMVVGSTGLVGKSLVAHLIEGKVSVKALLRNNKVSSDPLLDYIRVDFDNLQLPANTFSDIYDLYICLGTTIKKAGSKEAFQKVDIQYCLDIAKEAQKKGVRNISIITSLGSDSNSSNFYLKTKGLVENQIRALNFDSISIYRPGLLIGSREEIRTGEYLGQKIYPVLINPLLRGRLRKYRSINADILAKAMKRLSGFKEGVNIYYFDDFIKETASS
ncbi:NAD(P)H-binding protein [Gammaproteobacteria bacterium]|nr:NAD(P)H-binding protein [Gammaproteobacteria bacterium]